MSITYPFLVIKLCIFYIVFIFFFVFCVLNEFFTETKLLDSHLFSINMYIFTSVSQTIRPASLKIRIFQLIFVYSSVVVNIIALKMHMAERRRQLSPEGLLSHCFHSVLQYTHHAAYATYTLLYFNWQIFKRILQFDIMNESIKFHSGRLSNFCILLHSQPCIYCI